MKPTVSEIIILSLLFNFIARIFGSSVANNMSSENSLAPVNTLNKVDFPALVYPTNAIIGKGTLARDLR